MVKIYIETLGAVTADDFYELSYKLFLPDYRQHGNSEDGLNADSFKESTVFISWENNF